MAPSDRTEEQVAELLSAFVDLLNDGRAPTIDRYVADHPELAGELRPLLTACTGLSKTSIPESAVADDAAFNTVLGKYLASTEKATLRKAVESGRGTVEATQRPDVLLLLLRALGEVWGKTKLVKLLFLVEKETRTKEFVPDFCEHLAHNFGPFDGATYRDLAELARAGLIEAHRPQTKARSDREVDAVFRLTPKGRNFADALARSEQAKTGLTAEIQSIAAKYGQMPLKELLEHVYRTYPEYATKSKIRKEVLGEEDDT